MQLVLPQEATGRRVEFYQFTHPRENKPAKFLVDQGEDAPHPLYELTVVGSDLRSSLVGNSMSSDGSIVVATPLHPLFMIIGALYKHRNKPFSLDILLELAASESCQEIPEPMISPFIENICDTQDEKVLLNMDKLKEFLDIRTARVRAGLPLSVKEEVLQAVESTDPVLISMAEQYGAVSMLATSWLSDDVAEWYLSTYDFTPLIEEAKRLEQQHTVMNYMQQQSTQTSSSTSNEPKGIKRPNESKAKQPKRIKAENNRSILDMFKKK